MNFNVFRGLLRGFKNTISHTYDERLMLELEYDRSKCIRRCAIVQEVDLANLVSGTIGLSTQLPANSRVLWGGVFAKTALTLNTSTNSLSLGVTGTLNAYFTSNYSGASVFTAGLGDWKPTADSGARSGGSAASTIVLSITNASGASAGTNNTGTGTARVHLVYEYPQPMVAN